MARFEFRLPDIGEGIAEAEIVAWHVAVGETVKEDQQLADMMTDKATVELESPVTGTVVSLAGEVGDQVPIGSTLVVIETEGGEVAAPAPAPAAAPVDDGLDRRKVEDRRDNEPDRRETDRGTADRRVENWRAEPSQGELNPGKGRKQEEAPADLSQPAPGEQGMHGETAGQRGQDKVLASPAVRARARDLGIDLSEVRFAGDRIRHSDLDAYLLYHGGGTTGGGQARRADEDVKVVGLRRKIAENMQEAKRRIPHFTYVEEVNVTALEATRAMMNADRGDNPKLTLLPFLITAMCRVLPDYPQINARYDDDANIIHRSGAVHMGMAAQTDNGLSVPVIRNADRQSVWQLATEIARLAAATKAGKASREELSGSTITISSLGPMGGIVSTPVINRPEVAILAVNKVKDTPVVENGTIVVAKMMNLSISCDHRVVDGWDAASFMQDLKKILEKPLRLLS